MLCGVPPCGFDPNADPIRNRNGPGASGDGLSSPLMRTRALGNSGPQVSVVMFGTWAIGGGMWGPTDDDAAIAAMRRAFQLGVTAFDTADAYGWGHAEELVGEAFRGRRDEVFIATKLGITRKGINLSPDYFVKACDASLKRLGTDHVDLYQIH